MYATKVFHGKNSKDFIALNDNYVKKKTVKDSCKGKQFQTEPPKRGQTKGYFQNISYKTSTYTQGNKYIETQPRDQRKMGFGSHDARRRGEFTSDIRARQWREKLKTESEFEKNIQVKIAQRPVSANVDMLETPSERRQRRYAEKYTGRPELFQTKVPWELYDIGKTASTPICNKCSRETFYCRHRVASQQTKRPGTAPTTYETYGNFEKYPVEKPVFGNVNELKHFYDPSHLAPGGAHYTR